MTSVTVTEAAAIRRVARQAEHLVEQLAGREHLPPALFAYVHTAAADLTAAADACTELLDRSAKIPPAPSTALLRERLAERVES